MKLGLGTVQFGLNYGISNATGQIPPSEANRIINCALDAGIDLLDTAPVYGDSEQVLGTLLPKNCRAKLITKTPQFRSPTITENDVDALVKSALESLRKLGVRSIYGLMTHWVDDLFAVGGTRLFEAMLDLKARGLVEKLGVSVYSFDQIQRVLERFDIDLIQLPLNVLDQRLLTSGALTALKRKGIEIHSRSAFLQGLLLMDTARLTPYFDDIRSELIRYQHWLRSNQLTPTEGALAFIRTVSEIDYVMIGVTSVTELKELLLAWDKQSPAELDFSSFACTQEHIVNPMMWK